MNSCGHPKFKDFTMNPEQREPRRRRAERSPLDRGWLREDPAGLELTKDGASAYIRQGVST